MGLFPLGVFILTCSELTLVALTDIRDYAKLGQVSGFDTLSTTLASIYLGFAIVQIQYLIVS